MGGLGFCFGSYRLACFGVDRSVPVRLDRAMPTRLAFVSSPWPVDGGVAAADTFCDAEAATAHGVDGGTFKAYLFTGAGSPLDRLGSSSVVPWARPDGVVVVPDVSSFLADAVDLEAPLSNQQQYFWIGAVAGGNCSNWNVGDSSYPARGRSFDAEAWDGANVNDGFVMCSDTGTRLACFQR